MRRLTILAAAAATLAGCRSAPPETGLPTDGIGALEQVMLAGRGRERQAYTAYAISLYDLQLTFLELLPAGWFVGSREFRDGCRQIEEITGIPATYNPGAPDYGDLAHDLRQWHGWHSQTRAALGPNQREVRDQLFLRLEGTTPLLISREFRQLVRSVGGMSGLPSSWEGPTGEERYQSWVEFDRDRDAWRRWFETHRDELEWDEAEHRFRIGRGIAH